MVETAMIDQRIRKRTGIVPVSGMAYEPALLGEHDEVIVLEANVQRNSLADHGTHFDGIGHLDLNAVALGQHELF